MIHENLIASLQELEEDYGVPRNVKAKLNTMALTLTDTQDNLAVTRILDDLELISNDVNLPGFVRMKLLNITSNLEATPKKI